MTAPDTTALVRDLVRVWTDPGNNPTWHRRATDHVRAAMPGVAAALDQLAGPVRAAPVAADTAALWSPPVARPTPTVFECPQCGNRRRWRNLSTGNKGTTGDCKECGEHVASPITSSIAMNMSDTDTTTIGSGQTETNVW